MAGESGEPVLSLTLTLHLSADSYALDLEPEEGGAVARFEWQGEPLFYARRGAGPLNSACFPLVPFSNRIAFGRFQSDGGVVQLAPNFPDAEHPHTLHGHGWLAPWTVQCADESSATLAYRHDADAWPWAYEAQQRFELTAAGLRHDIEVRNLGETPMPAGVGVHPYFPRTAHTLYYGRHRGEWETSADGLPLTLSEQARAVDWWRGQAVSARAVDTVYVGREGPLTITWPERGVQLAIAPSADLSFTTVYTPSDADFFCVEPVSHETDAINRPGATAGLRWLDPGERFTVQVHYAASRLEAE